MRLARIDTPHGPRPVVADGDAWAVVEDLFADPVVRTGEVFPVAGTRLLAPVEPRVVLGMAHNGAPSDRDLPPEAFMKSARTVVGPGDEVHVDPAVGTVNAEGELVLVVGRRSRFVDVVDAPAHVLGWTIGNDVTNVDQDDPRATRVKNGDGYTPIGPWIETELPAAGQLAMTMYRNGDEVARSSTGQLAWNPYEAFSEMTRHMTLDAGDVLLTGSPATGFPVAAGDLCRCELEGLGALENPVVAVRRG